MTHIVCDELLAEFSENLSGQTETITEIERTVYGLEKTKNELKESASARKVDIILLKHIRRLMKVGGFTSGVFFANAKDLPRIITLIQKFIPDKKDVPWKNLFVDMTFLGKRESGFQPVRWMPADVEKIRVKVGDLEHPLISGGEEVALMAPTHCANFARIVEEFNQQPINPDRIKYDIQANCGYMTVSIELKGVYLINWLLYSLLKDGWSRSIVDDNK